MVLLFGWLTLGFLIMNIAILLQITTLLKKNGIPATRHWLRFKGVRYARQYRDLCIKTSGKPDKFYFGYIITFWLFIASFVLALLLHAGGR